MKPHCSYAAIDATYISALDSSLQRAQSGELIISIPIWEGWEEWYLPKHSMLPNYTPAEVSWSFPIHFSGVSVRPKPQALVKFPHLTQAKGLWI